ncbi:MFS transporter [Methanoculleus sp. FWC-SCC1]|uniref:MFS transporter n=1 Tax=Methanoculleus frigidifontis TaxID=2584085 RepID=A0ABT8M9Z4_9EURY|nr:MFS transporter [Methanoculleus sp. FWC-SCC1]MDN7024725.1 MFS transporter [Methanoculleus sp. FWC-SCC1]
MPPPPDSPGRVPAKTLYPLFAVSFIGSLGFSIVLPFLVFLVNDFGGNALIYGLLGSTYPAFQLAGAPLLGRASDLYGRKRILLLSQAGTFISWCIFLAALFLPVTVLAAVDSGILGAFTLTLPLLVLFIARALDGITGGNVSVANAYLADITEEAERNRNYGRMSVASNVGFILGPALAALLGGTRYGQVPPVLAALIIALIGVIVVAVWLPERRPCRITEKPEKPGIRTVFGQEQKECYRIEGEEEDAGLSFRGVFTLRHVPYILLLYFLIYLGFNIFYTAFPVYAAGPLAWTSTTLGLYLAALSGMMAFVQGPVLSRLSDRIAEGYLIVAGSAVLGVNFILLATGNLLLIYLAAVFIAVGNGLMWPSTLSALSKFAGKRYQGAVQGFASSAGSLASIVGLIAGGLLYEQLGAVTFLVTAGVIYLVFVLSLRVLGFRRVQEGGAKTGT